MTSSTFTIYNLYYAHEDPDGWPTFDHRGTFASQAEAIAAYNKEHEVVRNLIYCGERETCDLNGELRFPGTEFSKSPSRFGVIESAELAVFRAHVFTEQEVLTILRNMGHDVECGACMAIAFTGVGLPGDKHTCEAGRSRPEVIVRTEKGDL